MLVHDSSADTNYKLSPLPPPLSTLKCTKCHGTAEDEETGTGLGDKAVSRNVITWSAYMKAVSMVSRYRDGQRI